MIPSQTQLGLSWPVLSLQVPEISSLAPHHPTSTDQSLEGLPKTMNSTCVSAPLLVLLIKLWVLVLIGRGVKSCSRGLETTWDLLS